MISKENDVIYNPDACAFDTDPEGVKNALEKAINFVAEDISCYVRDPSSDMTRKRVIGPEKVIKFLICKQGKSIASEICDQVDEGQEFYPSAFCMQRYKIRHEAFIRVMALLNKFLKPMRTFNGYYIVACDGSDVNIPFMKNEADYIIENKTGKNYCQLHLNALYDCLNGVYWDAEMTTPVKKMEPSALIAMALRKNFPANSIIVCDRGYITYKLIVFFNEENQKFVIRSKDIDVSGSILERFDFPDAEFDKTVSVTLTRNHPRYLSNKKKYAKINSDNDFPYIETWSDEDYELTYRVVRFKLDDDTYETLVTNLTEDEMPFEYMKTLYHFRWSQEESYFTLKYKVGMIYLNSRKLEGVLQEIYAGLIMFNVAGAMTYSVNVNDEKREKEKAKKKRQHDLKANLSTAITNIRLFLRGKLSSAGLLNRIRMYVVPLRPGRSYPRNVRPQSLKPLNLRIS